MEKEYNGISVLQLIPTIISLLALVISLFTLIFNYYNQYFKKAKISIEIFDKMKCWLAEEKLRLVTSITFFNSGAQYGAVYKISAALFNKRSNTKSELIWDMFVQDKHIGVVGENFKSHTTFESWVDTTLIQGRSAVTKKIQFKSIQNFILQEGYYTFTVFVFSGTNRIPSYSMKREFKVGSQDLVKWEDIKEQYDIQNRISKKSLVLNLFN